MTSNTSSSVSPSELSMLESLADDSDLRFQLELEFVSLLANPHYLHALATDGTIDNPAFIAYIKYLHSTFSQSRYLQYVSHLHSLYTLELLATKKEFREAVKSREYCDLIHGQQFWHWRSWRYNIANSIQQKNATQQQQ